MFTKLSIIYTAWDTKIFIPSYSYDLICRQREFKSLKSKLVLLAAQYFPLGTRFDLSQESGKPANFGRRRKVAAATWFDKGLNKGELVPGKPEENLSMYPYYPLAADTSTNFQVSIRTT